jgi:hypothetical protein
MRCPYQEKRLSLQNRNQKEYQIMSSTMYDKDRVGDMGSPIASQIGSKQVSEDFIVII